MQVQVLRRSFLMSRREWQVTIGTDLKSVPKVTFVSCQMMWCSRLVAVGSGNYSGILNSSGNL